MEKLICRLFKSGLITTIIGTLIIILSVAMIYYKHPITEVSGWLALALTFLRSKDSLIGLKSGE
jgi:hypothetical protein